MSDRRRGKQKRQQELSENPTKEEKAVAKYLRFNVPVKEGKLVGMPVVYFIGSDAVNCLLDSKWAKKGKSPALFTTRASCVEYCNRLLMHGMFHRAIRQEKRRDKDKEKKKRKVKDDVEETIKEEERKTKKKLKPKEESGEKKEEGEDVEKKKTDDNTAKEKAEQKKDDNDEKDEKKEEAKKKKRKEKRVKLEMVDQQVFKDGNEVYVWIYDPVPFKTFVIGLFLVLGAIGVCLFPLWPPEVRLGVYYLSLSVAGCIGFLFCLCIVRVILFSIIWAITLGRHHFWLLPNLNEDVGFIESFVPLYHHEYFPKTSKPNEEDGNKIKSSDDKDKLQNDEGRTKALDDDKDNPDSTTQTKLLEHGHESTHDNPEKKDEDSGAGTESENDNGYEMVNVDELTTGDEEESKKDV